MRNLVAMLWLAVFALCFMATTTMAYEVTEDDISGEPTEQTTVKSSPNPELVGFFISKNSEIFAYALIEEGDQYSMFVKIKGKYEGWAKAVIDGDVIVFGKDGKAKIVIDDNHDVYRIFNNKKTLLTKIQ